MTTLDSAGRPQLLESERPAEAANAWPRLPFSGDR